MGVRVYYPHISMCSDGALLVYLGRAIYFFHVSVCGDGLCWVVGGGLYVGG